MEGGKRRRKKGRHQVGKKPRQQQQHRGKARTVGIALCLQTAVGPNRDSYDHTMFLLATFLPFLVARPLGPAPKAPKAPKAPLLPAALRPTPVTALLFVPLAPPLPLFPTLRKQTTEIDTSILLPSRTIHPAQHAQHHKGEEVQEPGSLTGKLL